ncbi:MAG: TolC family protein [Paludibacteraceae bacterium]
MKKIHFLIGLILFGTSWLPAQTLSLDSCKTLALRNNAKVQNAALDIDIARQTKNEALTKYFPNLKLTGIGYHALTPLLEVGIDDVPNANVRNLLNNLYAEYGATFGLPNSLSFFRNGYSANITATQPIFAGGRIVNGNKLATLGIEAAETQHDMAKQEMLQQTEESYWLVVSLQEKRKTLQQAQQLVDTLAHDLSGAIAAGLATQNEWLKISLKQNELKSKQLTLDNGITLAKMALCQTVGIDYTDTLVLTDSLTDAIVPPLDFYVPTDEAVAQRSETRLLELGIKSEQLQRKITLGETLPQIALMGSYGYGHLWDYSGGFNGLLLATIQIPLTDWWATGHKLTAHTKKVQIAENNQRNMTEQMRLQTQKAWNELLETYAQIGIADETCTDARQNLDIATQNYRAGLVPLSELLEAQTLLQQAIDQRNDARIDYQIALTRYRQLTKHN